MRLVVAEGLSGERKKEEKVVGKGCFFVEFGPNLLPL
jgi:hypothetical protein